MTTEQEPSEKTKVRLFRRVVHAGSWTLLGFGASQFLRLASNLVLTRLLFPEAFGLMAIVQSVLIGLTMLSDVGVDQSIVQNERAGSSKFVNTAWTVQVIRGVIIAVASSLLSIPAAIFYKNSEVALLLPAIGLSALIGGFASTNIAFARRNLGIKAITILDVVVNIVSLAIMIVFAWATHSVWSLVIGNLAGATLRTLASHLWLKGIKNRFSWDGQSLVSLMHFGTWIFVSTAVTFLVGEGNRLVIARLVDVRELAFFSLATNLSALPLQIVQQLGSKVFFPAYSELVRERPASLYNAMLKSRIIQIVPYLAICLIFIVFGETIIGVLYDERYRSVGWMLKLLALGGLPQSLIVSYGPLLFAKGLVRTSTFLLMIQFGIQIVMMFGGFYLGGIHGLILGLAMAMWCLYPFYAVVYSRLALWQPKVDLSVFVFSLVVTVLVLRAG